ncbi:unnamed protein product, partial [Closterium sp. Yama58-4]
DHTLVAMADDQILGWGYNSCGQAATGRESYAWMPMHVDWCVGKVQALAAGGGHSAVLTVADSLKLLAEFRLAHSLDTSLRRPGGLSECKESFDGRPGGREGSEEEEDGGVTLCRQRALAEQIVEESHRLGADSLVRYCLQFWLRVTSDIDPDMDEKEKPTARGRRRQSIMYLGLRKPKKRVIKPSEKFRFSFDWENTEDTSRDLNPLYQNPHEAQLLFGRGFRAGVDRREQKKLAAKNEADMRAAIREKEGVEERPEDAEAQQKREEAANAYDTFDMRVDRHWSEKKLSEMTERDWRIFREDFNIAYKGSKVPRPMRNWEESGLSPELLRAVKEIGYTKPSPIQMAALPIGLQQRDVIGIAETGSGKTCAFVLPMLTYISKLPPMTEANEAEGPYAVVMAPTRELAQQIEEETVKFAQFMNLRVVSIVGGQSIEEQGFKLRQGCEIVIATPGRLLDCLERRYAVLNQCNYVVLDEADRMIDMGFEPQVTGVLEAMNTSFLKPDSEDAELDASRIYRVTYMFSATMPPSVERLARKYLRNPVVVTIGTAGKATDLITQNVFMVKDSEKISRLQRILEGVGEDRTVIVFVNTKKTADGVAKQIDRMGFNVTTLHGGKTQEQREVSLEGFRTKKFNVLVATDVAGRGIDIPDVAHVINFDMPGNIEMYTHRIGRTGRAGKTGVATTFLTLHDSDLFYDLKQMLTQSGCAVPPELARHEAAKFKPGSIPDRPRRNEQLFTH